MTQRPAGEARGPRWGLLLVNVLLASALAFWMWQRLQPRIASDLRRDLLLDRQHVVFEHGFEDVDTFTIWNDLKQSNPDRAEVALPVRRNSAFTWKLGARRGVLHLAVARLQVGPEADASRCRLRIHVELESGASGSAGSESQLEVELPACAADPAAPAGVWREGLALPIELPLPEGAAALRFEVVSEGEIPPGAAVALLSPRVEQEPLSERLATHRVLVPQVERLLPQIKAESGEAAATVLFGERRRAAPDATPDATPDGAPSAATAGDAESIRVAPLEARASFVGHTAAGIDERPALVLTGAARASFKVSISAASVLRGAVALDERLPAGSAATLRVSVDGALVAAESVDSRRWRDLAVELGAFAGADRLLELELVEPRWPASAAQPVEHREFDFAAEQWVSWQVTAQAPRVAIADPRLEVSASLPRRMATAQRPSIVLIQVETLRADALPLYGGLPAELTPALAEFAKQAVLFESAQTSSPWTLPTSVSLLTGLPPTAHGAMNHDTLALPADKATLAERARAAGLATGAVVASDVLRPQAGFARGFESYAHIPYSNARQVNDLAGAFLENHAGQQFLLFLHYFDPHGPLNAPGEFRERYVDADLRGRSLAEAEARLVAAMRAALADGRTLSAEDPALSDDLRLLRQRYLGEIAYWDSQFGELLAGLKRMGLDDRTMVIVTADHGEEFLEHGLYGHGSQLFDETLHVPLLVRAPKKLRLAWPRGSRVDDLVSTTGLFASTLAWLGVPFDPLAVEAPLERPLPYVVNETSKGLALDGRGDPLRRYLASVRTAEHRLVLRQAVAGESAGGEALLYAQTADPGAAPGDVADRLLDTYRLPEDAERLSAEARHLLGLLDESLNWARARRAAAVLPGAGAETVELFEQIGYMNSKSPPVPPRR
ncbi:MAG: sulfatase-like hydrolase/transferase [Planctomycetota bacterium]